MLISVLAGAASGTVAFPLVGTVFGAGIGAVAGLGLSAVGAYVVVMTVQPHGAAADREGVSRALRIAIYGYGVVAEVVAYAIVAAFPIVHWAYEVAIWLASTPVLIMLLPVAVRRLTSTYMRAIGSQVASQSGAGVRGTTATGA